MCMLLSTKLNENESVALRLMTLNDTDKVVEWRNSEFVMKRFIYRIPLTRETHLNWIETKIKTGKVVQFIAMATGQNDTYEELGSTYLRDIDRNEKSAEFGIFFHEKVPAGHGYGKAAQMLTLKYAKEELGLKKVFARILDDNEASIKVHLSNGFRIIEDKFECVTLDGEEKRVIFLQKVL